MAVIEEAITAFPPELIQELYTLNIFVQALGGILIFYIIFNVINMFLNRRKNKQLMNINNNLEDIKKLLKKKK